MTKEIISSDKFPPAKGPYSTAVKANGFVFVSGQIPIVPQTGEMILDNIETATRQVLDNLKLVLEESGSSLEQVLKCQIFLKSMDDFQAMNSVYAEYFSKNPPARFCVEASKLPLDCQVEIDAVALA
jgi:2-iminobutanoate/2-iminopropanoate deaminase